MNNYTYEELTEGYQVSVRRDYLDHISSTIYDWNLGLYTPDRIHNLPEDYYDKFKARVKVLLTEEAGETIDIDELNAKAEQETNKHRNEVTESNRKLRDQIRKSKRPLMPTSEDDENQRNASLSVFTPVRRQDYQVINNDNPSQQIGNQQNILPQNQFSQQDDSSYQGGHQVIPTIAQLIVIMLVISIIVCTILYILKTYYSPVIIEEDVTKYKHKSKHTDSE